MLAKLTEAENCKREITKDTMENKKKINFNSTGYFHCKHSFYLQKVPSPSIILVLMLSRLEEELT